MVNRILKQTRLGEGSGSPHRPLGKQGFTVVEVIVALVILAVGVLGVAGTTVLVVTQTTLAEVSQDRSIALQSTLERLKALPFDSVVAGQDSIGAFQVSWTVTPRNRWKSVEIVTTGPGLAPAEGFPMVGHSIPDTFSHRILR